MSTTAMWLLLAVVIVVILFGSVLYKRTFTTKDVYKRQARIHLPMLLQVVEQVVHPVLDLALGLLREHHIAIGMDDVACLLYTSFWSASRVERLR